MTRDGQKIYVPDQMVFSDIFAAFRHFRHTGLAPDLADDATLELMAGYGYADYVAPTVQPWQTVGEFVNNAGTWTRLTTDRDVDAECALAIDLAADEARKRLVSPGMLVDQEYLFAYADATDYKNAGYTGIVPAGVSTWATAQGWTNQQAADDIIYQRALWKGASDQIRAQRLLGKAVVRAAVTAQGKYEATQDYCAVLNGLFGG